MIKIYLNAQMVNAEIRNLKKKKKMLQHKKLTQTNSFDIPKMCYIPHISSVMIWRGLSSFSQLHPVLMIELYLEKNLRHEWTIYIYSVFISLTLPRACILCHVTCSREVHGGRNVV